MYSLAQWALLYDVPFPYMVVREEMLPPESFRFFYLDKNYITALLDGAMSLGRSYAIDYQHDTKVIDTVMEREFCESIRIRPRLQKKEAKAQGDGRNAISEVVTGFLLRSVMVSGWRGWNLRLLRRKTTGSLCMCCGWKLWENRCCWAIYG